MNYQVYKPCTDLQPFIKCFWTLEDEGKVDPPRQRIVPDGCMEMIFHYGDLYKQHFADGSFIIQPRSFIFGQITNYLEISPTGSSGIIAARFMPDGLTPFITVPVSALANKAVSLDEVFGDEGKELENNVMASIDNSRRIKLVEDFLLCRLSDPGTVDVIAKACVDVIFQSQGQLGVLELSDKLNINRRNMERRFASVIGMSPKQLSKVVRLQATLRMLEHKRSESLTSIAHENGYYDQAHFIKDFKEFTGTSPKSFFAENLNLAALFIATE